MFFRKRREQIREDRRRYQRRVFLEDLEPRLVLSASPSAAFDLIDLYEMREKYPHIDGGGIGIAIIDGGVDRDHVDLTVNVKHVEDFVNPGTYYPNDHGTHVAGTAASTDPNIGVATAADIYGLDVFSTGGGTFSDIDDALQWVIDTHKTGNDYGHKIRVVNMSLGAIHVDTTYTSPTKGVENFSTTARLIRQLESLDVTVVTAAGNDYGFGEKRSSTGAYPNFEANSSAPGVFSTIVVGNVWEDHGPDEENDTRYCFIVSKQCDLYPSADHINESSQRPNPATGNVVFAPGSFIYSTTPNDTYEAMHGTSMASPMVAGVAALMQQAAHHYLGGYLTPVELRQIMIETGDKIIDGDDERSITNTSEGFQYTHNTYSRINALAAIDYIANLKIADDPNGTIGDSIEVGAFPREFIPHEFTSSPSLNITATIGFDGGKEVGPKDVDLYSFDVTTEGSVEFSTTSAFDIGDSIGTVLRLFDYNGAELARASSQSGARLAKELLPGSYFLGVSGFGNQSYSPDQPLSGSDGTTGLYHLDSRFYHAGSEQNGFLSTAMTVHLGSEASTFHGYVGDDYGDSVQTDVDLYKLELDEDGTLIVDINTKLYSPYSDTYLRFFDVHGNELYDPSLFDNAWAMDYVNGRRDIDFIEVANPLGYTESMSGQITGRTTDSSAFIPGLKKGDVIYVGVSGYGNHRYLPTSISNRTGGSNGYYEITFNHLSKDQNGRLRDSNIAQEDLWNHESIGWDWAFDPAIESDSIWVGNRDTDMYWFAPDYSGLVDVEVNSIANYATNDSVDTRINVFDSAGRIVAQRSHDFKSDDPRVFFDANGGQVYFVSITSNQNSLSNPYHSGTTGAGETGFYRWAWGNWPESKRYSLSDARIGNSAVKNLDLNLTYDEEIGYDEMLHTGATDVDLFRFTPELTGVYQFRAASKSDHWFSSVNPVIQLFDAQGQRLQIYDIGEDGKAEVLVVLEGATTYYFGLSGKPKPLQDGISQDDRIFEYDPKFELNSVEGDEGEYVFLASKLNYPPTLDPLSDVFADEDDPTITIDLSGISPGQYEEQEYDLKVVIQNEDLVTGEIIHTKNEDTGELKLNLKADQYGTSDVWVTIWDGGDDNNTETGIGDDPTTEFVTRHFKLTVSPVNDLPTINSMSDITTFEDVGSRTVGLSGISAGGGESQPITITALSTDESLIPDPEITYTSDNSNGTLKIIPADGQYGEATIHLTIRDAGLDLISGNDDDGIVYQSFDVTVTPVNDLPTIGSVQDYGVAEDSGTHFIDLSGITSGPHETQDLAVSIDVSSTDLFASTALLYESPDSTGKWRFTTADNQYGTAEITVTVTDAGLDDDLSTTSDNGQQVVQFEIEVTPVNDMPEFDVPASLIVDEDSGEHLIDMSSITAGPLDEQPMRFVITSSDESILDVTDVDYESANSHGDFVLKTQADANGELEITVHIEDGGIDKDLETESDNLSLTKTIDVTVNSVNDLPTIDEIAPLEVPPNSPMQSIELTGISPGGGESQSLRVAATSANAALVSSVDVFYTDGESDGKIEFAPTFGVTGESLIEIVITDPGLDGDFDTLSDNGVTIREFDFSVDSANDPPTIVLPSTITLNEDEDLAALLLTQISAGGNEQQPIEITVSNADGALIDSIVVDYDSPESTGAISIEPVLDQFGETSVVVTVTDSGFDMDLSTNGDNATITKNLDIVVLPVNDEPTVTSPVEVNLIEDVHIGENHIDIVGVSAGGGEDQPLAIRVSSDSDGILDELDVVWNHDQTAAQVEFHLGANVHGESQITLEIEDGGLDLDLATTDDNAISTRVIDVNVAGINDLPSFTVIDAVTIDEDSGVSTILATELNSGPLDDQPIRLSAVSSNSSLITVESTEVNSQTIELSISPQLDQFGTASVTVTLEDAGVDLNFETADDNLSVTTQITVTVDAVNDAPTLEIPRRIVVEEDSDLSETVFTNISAGGGEDQPIEFVVTAPVGELTSGFEVDYDVPETEGILRFTPVPDAFGSEVITISIEDGGLDGDLSTTDDNATVEYPVELVVSPVNDLPTIDPLDAMELNENEGVQIIGLSGISAGGGEDQPLRVEVVSDDQSLFRTLMVDYVDSSDAGELRFQTAKNHYGTAQVIVRVTDGGLDSDLATIEDNGVVTTEFELQINDINVKPEMADITLKPADDERLISKSLNQGLLSTATDADGDELTVELVDNARHGMLYVLENGMWAYWPKEGSNRVDTFSVIVTDGRLESDPVTVTIDLRDGYEWFNGIEPMDVDDDGMVNPIDALLVINQIHSGLYELESDRSQFSGMSFYDTSRDNHLSSIDALLVINRLNEMAEAGDVETDWAAIGSSEGEWESAEGEYVDWADRAADDARSAIDVALPESIREIADLDTLFGRADNIEFHQALSDIAIMELESEDSADNDSGVEELAIGIQDWFNVE